MEWIDSSAPLSPRIMLVADYDYNRDVFIDIEKALHVRTSTSYPAANRRLSRLCSSLSLIYRLLMIWFSIAKQKEIANIYMIVMLGCNL